MFCDMLHVQHNVSHLVSAAFVCDRLKNAVCVSHLSLQLVLRYRGSLLLHQPDLPLERLHHLHGLQRMHRIDGN